MPSLTQQQVNALYSGILMPQGGAFKPGPPVMLPPQAPALRTQTPPQQLLAQALAGADPVGDGLAPWAQLDDQVMASQAIPSANGTMVANKDQSQLAPSPAGNMFAYGAASPTAPATLAIAQALLTKPFSGSQGAISGANLFPSEANGMPIDSSTPTNIGQYSQSSGLGAIAPPSAGLAALPSGASSQGSANRNNGGGLAAIPAAQPTVQIATGKSVPVGSLSTSQGGRYTYQVQSDGSIKNLTTGRTTSPATS